MLTTSTFDIIPFFHYFIAATPADVNLDVAISVPVAILLLTIAVIIIICVKIRKSRSKSKSKIKKDITEESLEAQNVNEPVPSTPTGPTDQSTSVPMDICAPSVPGPEAPAAMRQSTPG